VTALATNQPETEDIMVKSISGAALIATLALAGPLTAQQTRQAPAQSAAHSSSMMAHMRAMDSLGVRVDSALARMNRATGEARVTAMAEVLNALGAERREMHAHMREMQAHEAGMMGGHSEGAKPHEHQKPAATRPDSTPRAPR
jgi:hypothetical protein